LGFQQDKTVESTSSSEYELDAEGRLVLVGLTWQETQEFKALDRTLPFDGQHVWPTAGVPLLPMEKRWHELWTKHQKKLGERRRA
jgi:hypothetical protein